jgi:serine/threonine protein kinase
MTDTVIKLEDHVRTMHDRYANVTKIAQGGQGKVFKAITEDGTIHAVKKMLLVDNSSLDRMDNEARLVQHNLNNHPHIASVIDYWEQPDEDGDPVPHIAFQWIEGETLAQRIDRKETFSGDDLERLYTQVMSAIDAAHEEGVIHCDLNPNNIMVDTKGDYSVIDFGIAKVEGVLTTINSMGKFAPFEYLAPEQRLKGESASSASDRYTFGMTWRAAAMMDLRGNISDRDPCDDVDLIGRVSSGLRSNVKMLLAENPEDRFEVNENTLGLVNRMSKVNTGLDENLKRGKDAFLYTVSGSMGGAISLFPYILQYSFAEMTIPGILSLAGAGIAAGTILYSMYENVKELVENPPEGDHGNFWDNSYSGVKTFTAGFIPGGIGAYFLADTDKIAIAAASGFGLLAARRAKNILEESIASGIGKFQEKEWYERWVESIGTIGGAVVGSVLSVIGAKIAGVEDPLTFAGVVSAGASVTGALGYRRARRLANEMRKSLDEHVENTPVDQLATRVASVIPTTSSNEVELMRQHGWEEEPSMQPELWVDPPAGRPILPSRLPDIEVTETGIEFYQSTVTKENRRKLNLSRVYKITRGWKVSSLDESLDKFGYKGNTAEIREPDSHDHIERGVEELHVIIGDKKYPLVGITRYSGISEEARNIADCGLDVKYEGEIIARAATLEERTTELAEYTHSKFFHVTSALFGSNNNNQYNLSTNLAIGGLGGVTLAANIIGEFLVGEFFDISYPGAYLIATAMIAKGVGSLIFGDKIDSLIEHVDKKYIQGEASILAGIAARATVFGIPGATCASMGYVSVGPISAGILGLIGAVVGGNIAIPILLGDNSENLVKEVEDLYSTKILDTSDVTSWFYKKRERIAENAANVDLDFKYDSIDDFTYDKLARIKNAVSITSQNYRVNPEPIEERVIQKHWKNPAQRLVDDYLFHEINPHADPDESIKSRDTNKMEKMYQFAKREGLKWDLGIAVYALEEKSNIHSLENPVLKQMINDYRAGVDY